MTGLIGLIILDISWILLIYELIQVFIWLEKKDYVYWDEKHSIEHLAYLSCYIIALSLWNLSYFWLVPLSYFLTSLWISWIFLWNHIKAERLGNNN